MKSMIELIDVPFGTRFVGYWYEGIGNQVPVKTFGEVVGNNIK